MPQNLDLATLLDLWIIEKEFPINIPQFWKGTANCAWDILGSNPNLNTVASNYKNGKSILWVSGGYWKQIDPTDPNFFKKLEEKLRINCRA